MWVSSEIGAPHKRTPAFSPQVNGKSERFNRTLLDEWAHARSYASNNERPLAFGPWLDYYNHHRPHTALGGLTPMEVLVNNVSGNHTWGRDGQRIRASGVNGPSIGRTTTPTLYPLSYRRASPDDTR